MSIVFTNEQNSCFKNLQIMTKIEKVPRGIQGEKSSKDMASSRNRKSNVLDLTALKIYK